MSNLVAHAERELKAAGLFDEDSDYAGMIGRAVLDLVKKFSEQGHSGASAAYVIHLFSEVASYKPLTPLTDDPEEWFYHEPETMGTETGFWQNKRNGEAFSSDGGKTYYLLSEGGHANNQQPLHESLKKDAQHA